jgi:glycosyltransferase involved in cell wall biosynthesis
MRKNISIIVPVYNEVEAIADVIGGLRTCFPKANIIVIDDGSTDGSLNKLDPSICKIVRHNQNRGYGASLKSGVRESESDIIAFFDGDGQFDPNDLDAMVDVFMKNGCHAVIGKRMASSHVNLSRSVGKFFLKRLAKYLTRKHIPDLNCGMRVMRRELFLRYQHIFPNGFSLSTTSTFVFLIRGYDVLFHPVTAGKRKGKSSVKFFKDGFNTLLLIIRLIAMFDPLRVFTPISFFLIAVAIGYSGWEACSMGLGIPVLGAVLGIGGLLMFFMGILCDQVSAIRLERYEPFDKDKA